MQIIEFLKEYYTLFFVGLTLLTALFTVHKALIFPFRWFAILIILLAILETIASAIGFFYHIKNHFIFNIIYILELLLVPFFFTYWLRRPWIKKVIRVYIIIFILFVLINTLWIQGFFTLQTYSFVLGGSFMLVLSVSYLWQLFTSEESQNIFRDPIFWFSLAYLLYFAVSVPYLGMLNYLWTNYPSFTTLYYELIFDATICLFNVLLTIGFLCMKTKTR